jgi:transposase
MSQGSTTSKQPLIRYVNRKQMSWRAVDVEHLIGEDHPARAIGALVGRLDLRAFYGAIESSVEEGGRPAFDPQLLISLWVYAYSQGIASAREVARRCEYDPAFQWLTGLAEVNDHTLADFRVEKQQELDELFTQVLAALSKEGLITLEQGMQDGTKIKAQASRRSYLPEETIREHLERARRRVAEMGDPRNDESSPKAKKAQARARREQQERLEGALEELEKWQARKSGENAKRETRVSTSDPQARVMKHPDKGFVLSDNAQISTDAAHGLMVGLAVTQEANDSAQLLPAVDRVEQRLEKKPQQMVADSGYTTRENIEKLAGARGRFSGDHAAGRCAARRQPEEPVSAERISLSAGEEPLCLPGGPSPASAGTTPGGSRDDLPPLRSPV